MTIDFAPVQASEIPAHLDIYNYYVKTSTATFHLEPRVESDIREMLMDKDSEYLTEARTIFFDGTLCGYVYFAPYKKREAYKASSEITLYLHPDFTGKGIGSVAVAYMETLARSAGVHTLLSVICGENEGSIRLFSKCGYDKVAHMKELGRKFGRLLDVVVYQKML